MLNYDLLVQEQTSNKKNVLFVFHGLGADKHDLQFLFDLWPECGLKAYFLQAPERVESFFGKAMPLSSWFHVSSVYTEDRQARQQRDEILQQCSSLVAEYQRQSYHIHVAGFSQGGVMALSFAQLFQCHTIALFSTFWPHPTLEPLSGTPSIFLAHGTADPLLPVERYQHLKNVLPHGSLYPVLQQNMGHTISDHISLAYTRFLKEKI